MNNEKRIPLILDGDPGHDDAIAWVIAASDPRFEIKAKVSENARKIAALLGLDIEVAKGREVPLIADLITGGDYHGTTGLDGPVLPEPEHPYSELSAVEMMAKVLQESEEPVIIVATGAQTNVAALLLTHPELKEKIRLISIMGGGLRNGNWTAGAEFNILVDPEAAYTVYHSGLPLQMCGLDVTHRAYLTDEEVETIGSYPNWAGRLMRDSTALVMKYYKSRNLTGLCVHDGCPVFYLDQPEMFQTSEANVTVETEGERMGQTVADYASQNPNCTVVWDLDRESFASQIMAIYKNYGQLW